MARQLRQRKSRPTYAQLAGIVSDEEDEVNQAGPSSMGQKAVEGDDDGSGSDFNPGREFNIPGESMDVDMEEDEGAFSKAGVDEDEEVAPVKRKRGRQPGKAKAAKVKVKPVAMDVDMDAVSEAEVEDGEEEPVKRNHKKPPGKAKAAKVRDKPAKMDVDMDGDEGADEEVEPKEDEEVLLKRKRGRPPGKASAAKVKDKPTKEKTAKEKPPKQKRVKGEGKLKVKVVKDTKSPGTVGPELAKRRNYSLPTPNVHHRHRAVPLYARVGQLERLTSPPELFKDPETTLSAGFTQSSKIYDGVSKAWNYNIGPGPLWDLADDRAWFKESITVGDDVDRESRRRPRVYTGIPLVNGIEILNIEDAVSYLPTDDVLTEEGNFQPPPPLPCYFGPFSSQTRHDVTMFETFPMSKYIPESRAHVFNAGAPVWGLDWCPVHYDDRSRRSYKQYLAVAPFPSRSHSPDIGRKVIRPSYSCIQIWSLSKSQQAPSQTASNEVDNGQMRCEMVLCLDTGPAYELKWCPLPSHDMNDNLAQPKKLGLLAGTFEDGSFSIFVVPDPSDFGGQNGSNPTCVKLSRPMLRIELEECCCWAFDWGNSEIVAIGTTNGCIAIYHIGSILKSVTDPNHPTITDILPSYYTTIHQCAIRALSWIKAPPSWPSGAPRVDEDPYVIASTGYDGMECLTDIREGRGSIMNRTRDVINAMAYSPFAGGPITLDHENTVKVYSASPSMLGRGHTMFDPQGPVWTVHTSDFHPQLAVGSADGICSTTNILRSPRRGGSVPFFVYKIFQMDYSRNAKEYRMLDRFLPQESLDRTTATRVAKSKGKDKEEEVPHPATGAWPKEVGVHRVVWNNGNGLAYSSMLAAGTASGLVRVDILWGKWAKDKARVPFAGITGVRLDDSDAMDVDSEGSDDSGT